MPWCTFAHGSDRPPEPEGVGALTPLYPLFFPRKKDCVHPELSARTTPASPRRNGNPDPNRGQTWPKSAPGERNRTASGTVLPILCVCCIGSANTLMNTRNRAVPTGISPTEGGVPCGEDAFCGIRCWLFGCSRATRCGATITAPASGR